MDADFWNTRYKETEFAYGIEPNQYLKSKINILKNNSKILCLAEGEGRNAFFLAENNHHVTAVDFSQEGLNKLKKQSNERNLKIETICVDLNNYLIEANTWDAIICIFGHFPNSLRKMIFNQVYKGLKPNGIFLMEAYNKNQLNHNTGGPKVIELLYNTEELKSDFFEFKNLTIENCKKEIEEGIYHNGISSVIQIIGIKENQVY